MITKVDFIKFVDEKYSADFPDEVKEFWEHYKSGSLKPDFTENGLKLLNFLRTPENREHKFSAKEIGTELFMSGRSVSGAMRKLVEEGYVEKHPGNPMNYSITEKGINIEN